MGVQDRIKRYRQSGGASGMVRVEVLIPPSARAELLASAAAARRRHREHREQLARSVDLAIENYGVRIADNLDLSRLSDIEEKARVLGKALMARGDAKAFIAGRRLLDAANQG